MHVDIWFGEQDEYVISFDWRAKGESSWDYMAVYLNDRSVLPTNASQLGTPISGELAEQRDWQHKVIIKSGLANSVKRFIVAWQNDGSFGYQPAVMASTMF